MFNVSQYSAQSFSFYHLNGQGSFTHGLHLNIKNSITSFISDPENSLHVTKQFKKTFSRLIGALRGILPPPGGPLLPLPPKHSHHMHEIFWILG